MASDAGLFEEALILFYEESADNILQFESSLLALEKESDDAETINALFRSAHTIKGSAGIFGLERIVKFTHQLESVLDRMRTGKLKINSKLSEVLLKSSDMLASLIDQEKDKITAPELLEQLDLEADSMASQLAIYLDSPPAAVEKKDQVIDVSANEIVETKPNEAHTDAWHISMRCGVDLFRNGFDPLTIIHYLESIGKVLYAGVDDLIPHWENFDPESCYLGFELRLQTSASRVEIETAFEFVQDDCTVKIFPPNRSSSNVIALINELPNENRLGEILVHCGALSQKELEEALAHQRSPENIDGIDGKGKLLGEILIEKNKIPEEIVNSALIKQSKSRDHRTEDSRFVKVPADRLDELINLVGELVICGSSASLQALSTRHSGLIETTQQMSTLVEEIRNGALSLRMVQIGETFVRYRRVVRDISAELGKNVQIEIEGADTELDKSVVEKIGDPLMHLVRNALDHGIETPQIRQAAGKPAKATIRLSASHDSGNIVIRVTDDGKGLDGEMLLKKARERGLIPQGQTLTESEKQNLIFAPGFSTAEKVTNLSGRGVGMDVVKKNIEALRGTVLLNSTVGVGTTVEIRLPLTLAIIDGFLVRIGRSSFVIPLDAVIECIDTNQQISNNNAGTAVAGHVDLRGNVLPFLDLRKIFSITDALPEKRSIVVVRSGDSKAGLLVDYLLGEYQTVIKPLGKLFQNLRGISGSTVLGSGEVALILDVQALVKLISKKESGQEIRSDALVEQ